MKARATKTDNTIVEIPFSYEEKKGIKALFIPKDSVGEGIEYIDILPDDCTAYEGEAGYAAI